MKKILICLLSVVLVACGGGNKQAATTAQYEQESPEFCADSAYAYVAAQCAYGPRTMNSAAHDSCGNWIAAKFESFGAVITNQYADGKLADGTPIKMRNIIASINPSATDRILISSHWDSRPWADNEADESLHQTPIDGANDGASGVGVMLEMARIIKANPGVVNLGVDFICWDAEDAGLHNDNASWCIGSQYWSGKHHVDGYTARYGILLDMVGGKGTLFNKEGYSVRYAPKVVDRVWAIGNSLGYGDYFCYTPDSEIGAVTDDHVQVNQGGIPCIDIIGNDPDGGFPSTWHTVNDNIQNISKETLKAVGQTLLEVLWLEK